MRKVWKELRDRGKAAQLGGGTASKEDPGRLPAMSHHPLCCFFYSACLALQSRKQGLRKVKSISQDSTAGQEAQGKKSGQPLISLVFFPVYQRKPHLGRKSTSGAPWQYPRQSTSIIFNLLPRKDFHFIIFHLLLFT